LKALKVLLTRRAESQLDALPRPAARRVVNALRILAGAPHSGRPYPHDSPFSGLFYKNVVVRARRWSYRVTYEIDDDGGVLWVHYLYPSSYPPTHPDFGRRRPDED
jgi:mRNA-degrading endonuclease RelE of RelBE toxin-antitoxin system